MCLRIEKRLLAEDLVEHGALVVLINWSIHYSDVNCNSHREPVPSFSMLFKVALRRAEALNRHYETDQAHERHVTWVTIHHRASLPLLKARSRVIGAERNQICGHC